MAAELALQLVEHPSPSRRYYPVSRGLWLILGAYTLLALAYNVALPPFEPSDEIHHFGYARYLAVNRRLPTMGVGVPSEYHQPPLYYALSAPIAALFPAGDYETYQARSNPSHGFYAWEPSVDNKNLYIHGPWDAWPFHDTSLAVHATRLVSLAAGWVTVFFTYQLARSFFDPAVAQAVAGMVAFTPMFLAVSGAIQNDAGAAAAGTVALWHANYVIRTGPTARRVAGLGVVIGLGLLCKVTVGLLLPAVAAILILECLGRPEARRRAMVHLAALGAGSVVVCGWWFVRNQWLYGDASAIAPNIDTFGRRLAPATPTEWIDSLRFAWTSFWGRFGHGDIVLQPWIYQALGLITILAVAGWLLRRWALPPADRLPVLLLAMAGAMEVAGLTLYFNLSPTGSNGRYAFPALAAMLVLLARGLIALSPARLRNWMPPAMVAAMMALSLHALVSYIVPAYQPPPALAEVPATAVPLNVQIGDLALLRGYSASTEQARPGDRVFVTLYWQPLRRTMQPYSVFLHLVRANDDNKMRFAQRDTYPGLGRNATTAWIPGQLFADRYMVIIPDDIPTPTAAYWEVGLWQVETGERALIASDGQMGSASLSFGQLVLTPRTPLTALPHSADALGLTLGDIAVIAGYRMPVGEVRPGNVLTVTVFWQPLRRTEQPYAVFVHMVDANGLLIAQRDTPPVQGHYPTTTWVPGQLFVDDYLVAIPVTARAPAQVHLEVGLWQPQTGDYAFVLDAKGEPVASGASFGGLTLEP